MSTLPIIEDIEKAQLKESFPEINVGDTVNVSTTIIEGKKKRVQKYEGVVVKIQGALSRKMFTVRRVIDRVGVEKSFLMQFKSSGTPVLMACISNLKPLGSDLSELYKYTGIPLAKA